jgi:hypothetical protein
MCTIVNLTLSSGHGTIHDGGGHDIDGQGGSFDDDDGGVDPSSSSSSEAMSTSVAVIMM